MVLAKIALSKLKEAGVKDAEKVLVDAFKAVEAALPEVLADASASALEKSLCGVAIPVLAAAQPAVEKLADLNHDGKIG